MLDCQPLTVCCRALYTAAVADVPRIDILVLASLARAPMHGYDIKMELRYKHVRWWAKCEHGHLYAALGRLHRDGYIVPADASPGKRGRVAYRITDTGR